MIRLLASPSLYTTLVTESANFDSHTDMIQIVERDSITLLRIKKILENLQRYLIRRINQTKGGESAFNFM